MGATPRYAGLGSRIVAYIIDILIVGVISLVLIGGLLFALGGDGLFIGNLLAVVINFGYFIYLEANNNGQTIGKSVVNIKVVDERGGTISIGASAVRNILRIVDQLPFFYIIGIVLILVTDDEQRLGDIAGDTYVVNA